MRSLAIPVSWALLALCCGPGEPPRGGPGEGLYSAQLHVHGSFSEGIGSIDSHSHEARDVGADVVWWSDHDFRIASYRHVTRFGFEDWEEPVDRNESWRVRADRNRESGRGKVVEVSGRRLVDASAEFVSADPREGERSLRVSASHPGPATGSHLYRFRSARGLHHRPLDSGISIRLSILAEEIGPDATAVVEVDLSEHPAPDGSFALHSLRYFCAVDGREAFREGARFHVPLDCPQGGWSEQRLRVTADAVRGFPEAPGRDNSLHALRLGVEARRGARASVRFDDLRIEQERSGEAAFAGQRALIRAVSARHPGLHQLQGVEISWAGRHLNEFSLEPRLLDYDALLREADRLAELTDRKAFAAFVARRASEAVHARGGLVSYNHMFGTRRFGASRADPAVLLETLLREDVFGADLLEVGYRERGGHDLEDHLWVWDGLSRAGRRIVGIGVSDSHGGPGQRWRSAPNNFVSWIRAPSPSRADLLEGLRRGRVFFGDIVLFDGDLELRTPDGARMGDRVVTDATRAEVWLVVDGLAVGDRLTVVESGTRAATHVAEGARLALRHVFGLPAGEPGFVRVEVRDASGRAKVLSNPIWFARDG